SVALWEAHREALHYHPVGYLALAGDVQASDLEAIAARHQSSGYRASLVRGEDNVWRYMRGLFPDWKARGLTACLHEHQGGCAFNRGPVPGLAGRARAAGVEVVAGVTVTGFRPDGTGRSVRQVVTDRGAIDVEQVVVAVGPWIQHLWRLLDLPQRIDVR